MGGEREELPLCFTEEKEEEALTLAFHTKKSEKQEKRKQRLSFVWVLGSSVTLVFIFHIFQRYKDT